MTAMPIRAGDRVADVLARDLALIDVFERHSSHFGKLRSAALRTTMARLVTVEQAAAIAGVGVERLVEELNVAAGIPAATGAPAPAPDLANAAAAIRSGGGGVASRHPHDRAIVELDLREDLRTGREPFSRIMSAVGALRDDEVLMLRTIFEPVPLYAVLGKRGFEHESQAHADDDWSVWFWREPEGAAGTVEVAPHSAPGADPLPAANETWLDVRGLEPPEPMVRTLEALESLPEGHTLVQVNVRTPQFLLPILTERGYEHVVDETQPDRVLVRIRRRS